jgi:uridine kinase
MWKSFTRKGVLKRLAAQIAAVSCDYPLRVAIDGVDAAGKTRLADDLIDPLETLGRRVIRASIDGFHHPKAVRYQRGPTSPQGYYQDSFDLEALKRELLHPLGPGGNRHYRCWVFDYRQDSPVQAPIATAPGDAILLCDGIFLLRTELLDCWDFSVFVDVDFSTALARASVRDLNADAPPVEIQALRNKYTQRYIPGQQIYFRQERPKEKATVVLNNNDYDYPFLEAGL